LNLTLISDIVEYELEELLEFLSSMPNISQIDLSLISRENAIDTVDQDLAFVTIAACPSVTTHPRLETLNVGLPVPDSDASVTSAPKVWEKARFMMLDISLEKISQVSNMCPVSFSYPLELREGVNQPCSLRELRLRSCQNLDVGDLQRAVESLKDVGAWDTGTLGRVVVERCDLLDYGTAVGVTGTGRLRFMRL